MKFLFFYFFIFICQLSFSQNNNYDSIFSLCNDGKLFPYYYPELKYTGGFWEIKKGFYSKHPIKQMDILNDNTGIVVIHFQVNCVGKTGNFIVKQYSLNYRKANIHTKIISFIINRIKSLKDWIPAKNEKGFAVNSHKFFFFRIISGIILEILPK